MKTIERILSLAILLVATPTIHGQGEVVFSNGYPNDGPFQYQDVNAPFFNYQGIPLAGPDYLAELYYGATASSLIPVGNPIPFLTGGYFYEGGIMLPGVLTSVWVQVHAWAAAGGSTYEQARSDGAWTGLSNVLFVQQVGGVGSPPIAGGELIGLRFLGVPEPSSLALGLIGAAGLVVFARRRK